jgi:hypothetical protein
MWQILSVGLRACLQMAFVHLATVVPPISLCASAPASSRAPQQVDSSVSAADIPWPWLLHDAPAAPCGLAAVKRAVSSCTELCPGQSADPEQPSLLARIRVGMPLKHSICCDGPESGHQIFA